MPDTFPVSVAAIQNEVLNLPADERAKLIDFLWDSLSETEWKTREAAWAVESERRISAFESGAIQARDARDVFSDLKKGL